MKKNTKLIIGVVVLVVVIAALLCVYLGTRPQTSQGAKAFTVEVVHSDGSSKTFEYRTDEEYLGTVLLEEGLVKGDVGQYGLYITEVDGEVADYNVDKGYWALYEGDEYAVQGADTTPIEDGDRFKLVYTVG